MTTPNMPMTSVRGKFIGRLLLISAAVFGGVLFIYMVFLMSRIVGYMGEMTVHMSSMSGDISALHDHIAVMASEVSKIDDVVLHMDENVNAMNTQITLIEESISQDMKTIGHSVSQMSTSLLAMDEKVGSIAVTVHQMGGLMSGMRFDIHRGTQSFTSPMDYMMNMMR